MIFVLSAISPVLSPSSLRPFAVTDSVYGRCLALLVFRLLLGTELVYGAIRAVFVQTWRVLFVLTWCMLFVRHDVCALY